MCIRDRSESAALTKLENEEISGIYQVGSSPSLTVASNGIPQSILQSILSGYETGKSTIRTIVRTHPSGLWDGIRQMLNQQETPVSYTHLDVYKRQAYVDWYQDKQPTREEAFDKLLTRIHPGAIVLLHNTSSTNGQILDELLTKWKEMGYTFGRLNDF